MSQAYVRVAVRIRPLLPREELHRDRVFVREVPGSPQLQLGSGQRFSFDYVFGPAAGQDQVYRACVQHLVASVAEGYNATVFCYGQTGSGKTYTLGGRSPGLLEEDGGVMERVAQDLFLLLGRRRSDQAVSVCASYLELHKDDLRDLLELPTVRKQLHIREDDRGNTVVMGAREVTVTSAEQLLSVVETGNALRHTAGTGMNEHSSRSHAILTLQVTLSHPHHNSSSLTSGWSSKLCLVDLAGSERNNKTGNTGLRLKESAHINTDLLALGNVIRCLSDPSRTRRGSFSGQHIPFRDSKLTRLLRDSLGGTAHTLMVACVSPSHTFIAETLSVLQFASKARHIRNCPGVAALQTQVKPESVASHPSGVRLVELQYELETLRELLKEKEEEVELEKKKISEKESVVSQSSLSAVSEPGKVTVQEDPDLLAQDAAVSSSDLSAGRRVQSRQERRTTGAVEGLEMSSAQQLHKFQEPAHREKQPLEDQDLELGLVLRRVEELVQERRTYVEALEEEKQRSRIQAEQLVTQQIVIDRLRSDLLTSGGKRSGSPVGCPGRRPHSVPPLSQDGRSSPSRVRSSPAAGPPGRLMAAFKIRGQLLQAEADLTEDVFCPFRGHCSQSKDTVVQEHHQQSDCHVTRFSLSRTWTSQDTGHNAGNPDQWRPRRPVVPRAAGAADNQTSPRQATTARGPAAVLHRRIQDLSVNLRMKEELIKTLDRTEKQIEAVERRGGSVDVLSSLSLQSQQVRREAYRSLQHFLLQRTHLQSSLQQHTHTSDGATLHSHEEGVITEESEEKLLMGNWLEEEEEQVLLRRAELQQLEEELRRREEVLQRREACLQQKSKLEMKIRRSSEEEQQEQQEEQQQQQEQQEQQQQQQQRLQQSLQQLQEDVEALDAALEFENGAIREQERNLAASPLHQSAELAGVEQKLRRLRRPEACELLLLYFNKVVRLREAERRLRLQCEELRLHARERDGAVRELEASMQRVALDTDRRLTEQHGRHLDAVQLLLHTVAEAVPGRVPGQVPGRVPGRVPGEEMQAMQDRLQQLEKELFFYKSSCRQLRKKLRDVHRDVHQDVLQDIHQDVHQDVLQDIHQDVQHDVLQDIHHDIHQDVLQDIHQDVQHDVQHDVLQDIHQDVLQDIHHDVHQDVLQDIHQDIHHDVHQDVLQDIHQDVQHDVQHDVLQDIHQDVLQDIHHDVHQDVLQDIHQDVQHDVQHDVLQDIHQDVHHDVLQDIHHDVHQDVLQDAPEPHRHGAHTHAHRPMRSKPGSRNVEQSEAAAAPAHAQGRLEDTDSNSRPSGTSKTAACRRAPPLAGPEEAVQMIPVCVSRRKLRQVPAPAAVPASATRGPQRSSSTTYEDSIEASRDT